MLISNFQIGDSPSDETMIRISGDVSYDDGAETRETLWFDVPQSLNDKLNMSADPWLAAFLPLAGQLGEDIEIDGEIDAELLECTRELLEWWQFWFPSFSVIEVRPQAVVDGLPAADSVIGQFFSGGVDSFFTLLRHLERPPLRAVDDLLIGWGFDIPITDRESFSRVRLALERVATETGRNLVPFATNFRETRLKTLPWGEIGHGNAMAAVALLLQNAYRRVLIPSTDGYREDGPWGSHAISDHMFSTSRTRIIHEGAAYTRYQKIRLVAESAIALSALRVCWRSQSDVNCGHCEKCLRTMIALDLCGVLDHADSFSHAKLDLTQVEKIFCPRTEIGTFDRYYQEMRDIAIAHKRADIARAIDTALRRSKYKRPLLDLTQRLSWNRYLGPVVRPIDAALRRTVII